MVNEKIRKEILGGSLTDNKNYLSGIYRGYYIIIEPTGNQYLITVNASSENDAENRFLLSFLERQKEAVKQLAAVSVFSGSLELLIQLPALGKNIAATVNEIVDPIINYLISSRYTSGCKTCRSTANPIACYEVNGRHHYICSSCSTQVENALRAQQQDILSKKSNLAAGLVGAFLGSLIGCVVWVLIYKLGYIAGIAGAVTGICAMKGYELLGGRLDKKGVIGSVIIMILSIYFANKVAWALDAYSVFKDYGVTFFDCFRSIGDIIAESDLTGNYFGDLAIGYVLTALATFRSIRNAFRASTGSYTMNKMN